MSELIKHECGIALTRLRKPLAYYAEKYGSALWGLQKMYLLLEKQHNRGQDGAGILSLKLNPPVGGQYMVRHRVTQPTPPWQALINQIERKLQAALQKYPDLLEDITALQTHFDFSGEVLIGHVRYATHGSLDVEASHPVTRRSNWRCRNLAIAGNFNLTNVEELLLALEALGQRPRYATDTETLLEGLGLLLDEHYDNLISIAKSHGLQGGAAADWAAIHLDSMVLLKQAATQWDGGYVFVGALGHGEVFIARDPNGIRPAYYIINEEVIAAASERPALTAAFEQNIEDIIELPPAHALIVRPDGSYELSRFTESKTRTACSFERIYFSRGTDPDIYQERKALGHQLVPDVAAAIENDFENTVFSYIPNTAQVAFIGLVEGLQQYIKQNLPQSETARVRVESVVSKDTRLRTFIADKASRTLMASHVYDVTHNSLRAGIDTLVCLDDSIVRGTTLRESILKSLLRLRPRRIIIVSSAPQIRYPDCYGIDMSQIEHFIAFEALIQLLHDNNQADLLSEAYNHCKALERQNSLDTINVVQTLYERYSAQAISHKIAQLLLPDELPPLSVLYQRIESLHKALPNHLGDWYFTGNYPTKGGNRVVNRAFMNYIEGKNQRAY